jgi:hypothetical protein
LMSGGRAAHQGFKQIGSFSVLWLYFQVAIEFLQRHRGGSDVPREKKGRARQEDERRQGEARCAGSFAELPKPAHEGGVWSGSATNAVPRRIRRVRFNSQRHRPASFLLRNQGRFLLDMTNKGVYLIDIRRTRAGIL